MSMLLRKMTAAPNGRYFTPRSASGMRATMISALKITALRIALCGECRNMIFSLSSGPRPRAAVAYSRPNMAGMMAKYLETSLAMLNVVSAPRVISNCFPSKRRRNSCKASSNVSASSRLGTAPATSRGPKYRRPGTFESNFAVREVRSSLAPQATSSHAPAITRLKVP